MKIRRRRALLGAAAGVLTLGCKRSRDPVVPQIWDEAPVPERAEALGKLAPPWPAPARAVLSTGLLTYWLTEPAASLAHVRLLIPDHDGAPLPAAVVASVSRALLVEVRRRLGGAGARVAVEHGPGRLELVLHGPAASVPRMGRALASTLSLNLGNTKQLGKLTRARDRVGKTARPATSRDLAAAVTVSQLLQQPLDTQRIPAGRVSSVASSTLARAWQSIIDPRRCALIVHAPQTPEQAPNVLAALDRWVGQGKVDTVETALGRLRWSAPELPTPQNLLTDDGAPILLPSEPSSDGGALVVGRKIDTPSISARAIARLAQRIAGEELDVRLSISGPQAIFTATISVTDRNAEARAQRLIEDLASFGQKRQPQQRLFQATQLWLGARVVQASLQGEDWTRLWSESIDLADDEPGVPRALAADATQMLAVEAEPLSAWMKQSLDPRLGQPGWSWAVAGATPRMERQLSRVAEVVRIASQS